MRAVQAERDKAKAARDASAAEVERALRQRYERLRGSRVARVVVPLAGAACGACFTTIPLNRRSQPMRKKLCARPRSIMSRASTMSIRRA